jgi:hypothetical protein
MAGRPKGETIPNKCAGCKNVHFTRIGRSCKMKKICVKLNKYCIEAVKECRGKNYDRFNKNDMG